MISLLKAGYITSEGVLLAGSVLAYSCVCIVRQSCYGINPFHPSGCCVLSDVPQVQYILCIRPNMENDPVLFEDEYVTQQLLSASIVEAAQVCILLQFDDRPMEKASYRRCRIHSAFIFSPFSPIGNHSTLPCGACL